jgi:hypothetical protein
MLEVILKDSQVDEVDSNEAAPEKSYVVVAKI